MLLLRARSVLPMNVPPIDDGVVVVTDGVIADARRWRDGARGAADQVVDLGDVILLPGLINTHCHLDYTAMAGRLPPLKSFPDWIAAMLAFKASWSYTEFAQSWLGGARQLLRSGVTTVVDIEAVPELLPEIWHSTALRVVSCLELTGVRSRRPAAEILGEAEARIDSLSRGRNTGGLSPHAPYSTSLDLLRRAGDLARRRGWRVTTHVAESEAEFLMFAERRGAMFDWLKSQRDMADCGRGTPVQHLARAGLLGANFLAVHANYLGGGDAELLGGASASVVHCPRSHQYFGHQPFPLGQLQAARVNVCLGTDSLATVRRSDRQAPELDLFSELRLFSGIHPGLAPEGLLRMVTVNAARAIGREGRVGELKPGADADLITIPFRGGSRDTAAAAVHHVGEVAASMIGGDWVIPPAAGISAT